MLYLVFATVLISGARYLMMQTTRESGNIVIMVCNIVGVLYFEVYFFCGQIEETITVVTVF